MRLIDASIPWTPKSKERPRHNAWGTYTPKATIDAEAAIVDELWRAGLIPEEPIDDPIALAIYFGGESLYIQMDITAPPEEKGMHRDADNMGKLVLDAFNGVLYDDDKQIVDLRLVKM